jgi:hypothetical protein
VPNTVDEALDRFWKQTHTDNSPDYTGFLNWIAEKLKTFDSRTVVPIHAITDFPDEAQFNRELFAAAKDAGIEITKDAVCANPKLFGKGAGSRLKALNRAKLLLSFFKDLPQRTRESMIITITPSRQRSSIAVAADAKDVKP